MSEENPYSVSPECIGGENAREGVPSGGFVVDGDKIICGNSVGLPPICIFTGLRDDLVPLTVVAQYSSWRLVIRQHSVRCLLFVRRSLYQQHRRNRIGGTVLAVLGLFVMFGGPILLVAPPVTFLLGIVLVVLGFILTQTQQVVLWIHRHRGNQYWIEGIRPQFFSALEELVKTAQSNSPGA